jgi:GTP-binding protein
MSSVTVVAAQFVAGADKLSSLPKGEQAEVAFIGRSNVGKSSLMNMLMQRKGLVRTSRTPGQTRQVNLFLAELQRRRGRASVMLVDLPGYGYSTAGAATEKQMSELLSDYLYKREALRVIVHLIDARHGVTKADAEAAEALSDTKAVRLFVGTKADLVTAGNRPKCRQELAASLSVSLDDVLLVSSDKHEGRDELWARLLPHLLRSDDNDAAAGEATSDG